MGLRTRRSGPTDKGSPCAARRSDEVSVGAEPCAKCWGHNKDTCSGAEDTCKKPEMMGREFLLSPHWEGISPSR